ncbi:MAG: transcriptional repressor LexA [Clostridiaceae bacterium]|nr:transcriptional repressor LexA [Clostridiaceae bacterium]
MNLLKIQNKFIGAKPYECNIVKGKSNTGKTEALLHRVLNVVHNYAYEEDDKILFVQKEKHLKDKFKLRYEKIQANNTYDYYSLLSSNKEPEFISFDELINRYSEKQRLATFKDKSAIIKAIFRDNSFKKCKKLKMENLHILLSEIKFMKNNRVNSEDEFMTLMGNPLKLRKNSASRKDMYRFYVLYNEGLKANGIQDNEDKVISAIKTIEEKQNCKYSHIFIENVEGLSKLELEFLLKLYNRKTYGSITLAIDVDKGENVYSELVKKGRVYAKKVFGMNKKIFNFKTDVTVKKSEKVISFPKIEDKFEFVDLKHRREFNFTLEDNGHDFDFVDDSNEKYKSDELKTLPVYSNIAAGEPILINPAQEDTFKLPKFWIKSGNEKFILKVKGDSMINANIDDGDLVVIEQNPSPLNGDIVAVNIDGSATLKRLQMGKDKVVLLPENPMYSPIEVHKDQEFSVLGVALGIIKKK